MAIVTVKSLVLSHSFIVILSFQQCHNNREGLTDIGLKLQPVPNSIAAHLFRRDRRGPLPGKWEVSGRSTNGPFFFPPQGASIDDVRTEGRGVQEIPRIWGHKEYRNPLLGGP